MGEELARNEKTDQGHLRRMGKGKENEQRNKKVMRKAKRKEKKKECENL